MRTVFMGTPDFAVNVLDAMVQAGHEVGYVITQPDKARDRGKKVQFTPVKEKALEYGLTVLQPEKVRGNEELLAQLKEYNPDIMVVVAYGQILPKEVLDLPRLGCVNVHASLLPKLRGASPIQNAIVTGEEVTGVTIMQMGEGLDTGDMLEMAETPIGKEETAGELMDRLALMGAELLLSTLKKLEEGTAVRRVQDESLATYAPMLKKQDGALDFNRPAKELDWLIRGVAPWPSAYTYLDGKLFKVHKAIPLTGMTGEPGTWADGKKLIVYCGEGALELVEIQPEGGKRMRAEDFLRGRREGTERKFTSSTTL